MQVDELIKFVKLISNDIQTLTERIDKVTDMPRSLIETSRIIGTNCNAHNR